MTTYGSKCLRLTDNVKLAQAGRHESRPQEVIGSISTRNKFFELN